MTELNFHKQAICYSIQYYLQGTVTCSTMSCPIDDVQHRNARKMLAGHVPRVPILPIGDARRSSFMGELNFPRRCRSQSVPEFAVIHSVSPAQVYIAKADTNSLLLDPFKTAVSKAFIHDVGRSCGHQATLDGVFSNKALLLYRCKPSYLPTIIGHRTQQVSLCNIWGRTFGPTTNVILTFYRFNFMQLVRQRAAMLVIARHSVEST